MNKIIALLFTVIAVSSCQKYLDTKPDRSLAVPSSLKDLQSILDYTDLNNSAYSNVVEAATDDYYVETSDWLPRSTTERNVYIWEKDVFNESERNDWSVPYIPVYHANVVLEHEKKLDPDKSTTEERENLRGQALFLRSFAFFNLLQVFAKPYIEDSADIHLGIALRLDPNLNNATTRATVRQSYEQIIKDVKTAVTLLPSSQVVKTRPSKAAAMGFLSRVYLSMSDYINAAAYADSALQQASTLLDFNHINISAAWPFARFNDEVTFHANITLSLSTCLYSKVDSVLYNAYADNDLRKKAFFLVNPDGTHSFKGSYDGSLWLFYGMAIDEQYLIRAEANARLGKIQQALDDLNTLLTTRYKAGTFSVYTAANTADPLGLILLERRKELVFRGQRWTDLRRLNQEARFAKTLVRKIDNKQYVLPPNDPRYVFPIPEYIIKMTGIPQN